MIFVRAWETTVLSDHHQFLLYGGEEVTDGDGLIPDGTGDGLVVPGRIGLKILTGTTYGQVGLRVEIRNREPELPAADWTEVSDLSFHLRTGPLLVGTLMDGPEVDCPDLAANGRGWYRLRIAARGRDDGPRWGPPPGPESPREHYLIAVWAAPRAPSAVHRRSDQTGRSFRGEPLAPPVEETVAGPARVAFHDLTELLRTGAAAGSPATGRIDLTATVAAPPEQVSAHLDNAVFWPVWLAGSGAPEFQGTWHAMLGPRGSLDNLRIAGNMVRDSPGLTTSWRYEALTTPSAADPFPRYEPLLPVPSRLDVSWAAEGDVTAVRVLHRDLPQVLVSRLEDLWRYHLTSLATACEAGALPPLPW